MIALRYKMKNPINVLVRLYNTNPALTSSAIRSRFLEYFVNENDHSFIRSCPLKPLSDRTIPFVNAGMVQFKTVLQGYNLPPASRVANSQKCARVGGKHNDLDTVGVDGYHHTFFEMLGNWSFGECNKHEACKLAWDLLTGPYGLDPKRLYVTYFGGDSQMGLDADLETKDIWRQLNVSNSHILPFDAKDNFWEMGLVGPCGPCTEIHVDHIPERQNAAQRVNAGFSDLTELWNLVFIQFNRNVDGSLHPLKHAHVDTGMGFERLVAVLNGVDSNYGTDLFNPLLEAIHKITGFPAYSHTFDQSHPSFERDRAYRIICDHSRLLTVALADGIVPHNECKLRWVLRRALNLASDVFKTDEKLLMELSNFVAESLHSSFPEVGRNLSKVKRIIQDEAEIYKSLKLEFPKSWLYLIKERPDVESLQEFGSNRNSLASAFKKMNSNSDAEVSPALAFHLYESHGMNVELITEMAKLSGKMFDVAAYEKVLEEVKTKSKLCTALGETTNTLLDVLASAEIPETYYNFMYDYDVVDDGYSFPPVFAKVVGLVVNGELQSEAEGGTECGLILDRTNFYHTAGGQESDVGNITVTSGCGHYLAVKEVSKIGDYIFHFGNLNGSIKVGDEVVAEINQEKRVACMRNHTLAHLINAEMKNLFDAPIQENCVVQPSHLKFTYYLHGENFDAKHAKKLEDAVAHAVESEIPVDRYSVNVWQLPAGTTLVPSETYPVEDIHILDIKRGNRNISREACCGTHVLNTKDIGEFCIVEVIKSKNVSVCAVTGSEAEIAITNSQKLSESVNDLILNIFKVEELVRGLNKELANLPSIPAIKTYVDEITRVHKMHKKIKDTIQEISRRCSYVTYDASVTALKEASSKIHNMACFLSELEVKRRAQDSKVVSYVMQLSELLEKVPLNKYTRLVPNPIMLFSYQDNEIKVRCCIPKDYVTEDFNALLWMQEALSHLVQSDQDAVVVAFAKEGQSARVQSRSLVYKSRIPTHVRKERCRKASGAAHDFAQSRIKVIDGKRKRN